MYTHNINRIQLYGKGKRRLAKWCHLNEIDPPGIIATPRELWRFSPCAYYRPIMITICIEKCALPGRGGRAWSWPGYVIDRTPYGVLAHELGHHVDWLKSDQKGSYFGNFSAKMRRQAGEQKLTGYSPNDAEWFAEMFRLFVTNPDLLSHVRPGAYGLMCEAGLKPIAGDWQTVLAGAPARTLEQARKKAGLEAEGV